MVREAHYRSNLQIVVGVLVDKIAYEKIIYGVRCLTFIGTSGWAFGNDYVYPGITNSFLEFLEFFGVRI